VQQICIEPGQDRKVAAIQASICVCHFIYLMKHTEEYYMRLALKQAEKARDMDEVPVGAVIVYNDKVIARAHNLREKNRQPDAHAEMLAIRKACKKLGTWCLKDCDLYVTLEPCMMCTGVIAQARINRLYYGTTDPKGGTVDTLIQVKDIKHLKTYPREVHAGILQKECSEILSDFFREKRKKPKKDPSSFDVKE